MLVQPLQLVASNLSAALKLNRLDIIWEPKHHLNVPSSSANSNIKQVDHLAQENVQPDTILETPQPVSVTADNHHTNRYISKNYKLNAKGFNMKLKPLVCSKCIVRATYYDSMLDHGRTYSLKSICNFDLGWALAGARRCFCRLNVYHSLRLSLSAAET